MNPAQQDPKQFISFRKEVPFAIGGNPSGKATIKTLGLEREPLREERFKNLNRLIALRIVVKEAPKLSTAEEGRRLIEYAAKEIAFALSDAGKFAVMARAASKEEFNFYMP